MFKEAWPSPEKIERLRQGGETPYSSALVVCCVFVALTGSFYFKGAEFLDRLSQVLSASNLADFTAVKATVGFMVINFLILPALASLALALALIFLMRRFVFNLGAALPELKRFSVIANLKKIFSLGLIWQTFLFFALGLLMLGPLTFIVGHSFFGFFNQPSLTVKIFSEFSSAFVLLVIFGVAVSVVSYLFAWSSFYTRQRMSKDEMQAEGRGRARDFIERV